MFYGSQGEEKAARKLRDNIPKASMRYSFLSVAALFDGMHFVESIRVQEVRATDNALRVQQGY